MAKKYFWEIKEVTEENAEVTHSVSLVCSAISGKAIITIDGDEYNISVKPFSLKGTNQMFRLGEMAALIDFPKKGEPRIIIDGEAVEASKS
ncbi:MAG: hypothetical protein E7653_06060 [Ruminococcaceae bacterium]|nr:hypothetical protein [Oscillospiraceae bacterium]